MKDLRPPSLPQRGVCGVAHRLRRLLKRPQSLLNTAATFLPFRRFKRKRGGDRLDNRLERWIEAPRDPAQIALLPGASADEERTAANELESWS